MAFPEPPRDTNATRRKKSNLENVIWRQNRPPRGHSNLKILGFTAIKLIFSKSDLFDLRASPRLHLDTFGGARVPPGPSPDVPRHPPEDPGGIEIDPKRSRDLPGASRDQKGSPKATQTTPNRPQTTTICFNFSVYVYFLLF